MDDTRQLVIARFNAIRADLEEALDRTDSIDLSWAPKEGMRTLGGQLQEISATEVQLVSMLKNGKPDSYNSVWDACEKNSLIDYRAQLQEIRAATLAYVESLPTGVIDQPIVIPAGWWDGFGFDSVPRAEILRNIAQHEWYHTGQIVSYLWFAGQNPYD
jgi:uncharacterized damage-inducible protein DinB